MITSGEQILEVAASILIFILSLIGVMLHLLPFSPELMMLWAIYLALLAKGFKPSQ